MPVKDNMFKDRAFLSKLVELALPIALQSLMLALVAAADAFMLGVLAQNDMSAVSLASQIQFVQNMALSSITSAAAILGAQYWGKGDKRTVNDIFFMSLRVSALVSFVFFVGCVFFPETLMSLFTNEAELNAIGCRYLRIAGWSYLLTGISQSYLSLLKYTEHAKASAAVSTTAVLLNIVLNAVLIYGLLGAPALGVQGAATATLIARVVELAAVVALTFRKGFFKPQFSRILTHIRVLWHDYSKCMLPVLGAALVWGIGFTSYTAFMGHLGTDSAAANSIASVVRDLVCCLCNGLAAGGCILVGNELGAGHLEKGRLYGDRLAVISFLCGLLSTVIMLAVTPLLMRMVKLTDGARGLLTGMMIIMAFYMIGRAVNTIVINGVFYAGNDTMFDLYSLAVCMWGLAVPLAFLGTFVFHWSPLVVYAMTCLDEVGKIPWVMHHFKKYKWVKDLTRQITD